MAKSNISIFEDAIEKAKNDFYIELKNFLKLINDNTNDSTLIQKGINELHSKAISYFNLFERSINEYGLPFYEQNTNIKNSKLDDAINLSNSIQKYWTVLKKIKSKTGIIIPRPSERAYCSIQMFIQKFEPKKAKELENIFKAANLPIEGFTTNRKHIDMTNKKQITFGVLIGTVFLIALLVLGILIDCPTEYQNRIFTTILALSAASFAATIPGFIKVNYKNIISASGAIAIFVIVYVFKPANLSDFNNCHKDFKGTVYFGNSPLEAANIQIITLGKSTTTNNFGNFNFDISHSEFEEKLKLRLFSKEIQLDSIIDINTDDLAAPINFKIPKYCIQCIVKDSNNNLMGSKTQCSSNKSYLSKYANGYKQAKYEQGLKVECSY